MFKIVVFEENSSGDKKIQGITRHGSGLDIVKRYNIEEALPEIVDDPDEFIPEDFNADLVLDFLKHPDLSAHLAQVCKKKKIPVIASGKKHADALIPFTWCGLGRLQAAGLYGEQFGLPEYKVEVEDDRIKSIEIKRGAPCGATWDVLARVIGLPVEEAITTLAREVQYICYADPSGFDPISGKSPLHYAGEVHAAAFKKALSETDSW
jgi:hypothetical protein